MLRIDPDKVGYIILKAREFDEKVAPKKLECGSNPSNDQSVEILEDYADDPTYQELMAALENLSEDEMVELRALTWIGRGDFGREERREALRQTRLTRNEQAARYLAGTPMLGDFLEERLASLSYSCEGVERGGP